MRITPSPSHKYENRILIYSSHRNACLTGFPFMAVIVNLPQRFQAVDGLSPTAAGIHLLPLLLCSPFASGLSGILVTKFRVPPAYLVITGSALQLLGVGLASSLPSNRQSLLPAQYGYEVLMGFGFGFGLSTLLVLVPMVVSKQDIGKVYLSGYGKNSGTDDRCSGRHGSHNSNSCFRWYCWPRHMV